MLPGWTYEFTLSAGATASRVLSTMNIMLSNDVNTTRDVLWSRSGVDLESNSTYELQILLGDDESHNVQVQFSAVSGQERLDQAEAPSEAVLLVSLVAAALVLLYTIASMRPTVNSFLSTENTSAHMEPLLPRSSAAERNQQQQPPPVRLESLDVFRGLTICLMIFVNYGGTFCSSNVCSVFLETEWLV